MRINRVEIDRGQDTGAALAAFQGIFPSTQGPTIDDMSDPAQTAQALDRPEPGDVPGIIRAEYERGGHLRSVALLSATKRRAFVLHAGGRAVIELDSEVAAAKLIPRLVAAGVDALVYADWGDGHLTGRPMAEYRAPVESLPPVQSPFVAHPPYRRGGAWVIPETAEVPSEE